MTTTLFLLPTAARTEPACDKCEDETVVDETPDQTDDKRDAVKKKPSGRFTIGAGYAPQENFIGHASIANSNLFGTGQSLALSATIPRSVRVWIWSERAHGQAIRRLCRRT
jgi:hypothetical protein